MEITVTESAHNEIQDQLAKYELQALKLVYDNEGCGCAVNGVAQLWMIPAVTATAALPEATGSAFQIVYAQKDLIYFEEHLILDYRAAGRAFVLKSANQTYNNSMDLIAKGALN